MMVVGLDGNQYSWNPSRSQGNISDKNRSQLHLDARILLKKLFPFDRILEEVSLPGTKSGSRKTILYSDFYIPNRSLMIEVHGEQHFEFNSFFHKDRMSFYKSRARDRDKATWCELNHITLVELRFNETEQEWRNKLE